jgi:DNA-binding response OmpR family regulator
MSVLIADNDRAVSGLLSEVLQQSGFTVEHAYDGEAASELARGADVQVLVCDLDMPGVSGLEVLASLMDLERPPRAIVISGFLDARIEAALAAMPFVEEVMRKPFDLMVFAAVVRRIAAATAGLRTGNNVQTQQSGAATEL